MMRWKVVSTVAGLTAIAVTGIAFGQVEIAYIAVGALAGYLGKVNGSSGGGGG